MFDDSQDSHSHLPRALHRRQAAREYLHQYRLAPVRGPKHSDISITIVAGGTLHALSSPMASSPSDQQSIEPASGGGSIPSPTAIDILGDDARSDGDFDMSCMSEAPSVASGGVATPAPSANPGLLPTATNAPVIRSNSIGPNSTDVVRNNTASGRKPRIKWDDELKTAMLVQVQGEKPQIAGYKYRGERWNAVALSLGTLPAFEKYGGIAWGACKRTYQHIVQAHRHMVKNGEWISGKREGHPPELTNLANICMAEEDEVTEKREREEQTNAARNEAKEERAQQALEAAPAASRSRQRRRSSSPVMVSTMPSESEEVERVSSPGASSAGFQPLEDTVREYFQSKADSPNTKKGRLDVEERKSEALLVEAKARAEEVSLMAKARTEEAKSRAEEVSLMRILANSQESPMSKQRRHQLEAQDAATRAADAQTRETEAATSRLEIEARGRETKAVVDLQKSVMYMVSKMVEKFN